MALQFRTSQILFLFLTALCLAGCGQDEADGAAAQIGAPPALVTVLSVKPETVVVCTENLIRVDDVMESPKLAE